MTQVIIQGEEGSNSSVAARQLYGPQVALVCCDSFDAAFAALESPGAVAVLPVENSTAGVVPAVHARLAREPTLFVLGETRVSIRFVAAARPGQATIERILAHPMAAKQCQAFLRRVGWRVIDAHDTAGAARLVSEGVDASLAALCPAAAAQTYGLRIIEASCGDDPKAVTRFCAVTLDQAVRARAPGLT